jgi:hypothetical protein
VKRLLELRGKLACFTPIQSIKGEKKTLALSAHAECAEVAALLFFLFILYFLSSIKQ